jgi:hypothetical protein
VLDTIIKIVQRGLNSCRRTVRNFNISRSNENPTGINLTDQQLSEIRQITRDLNINVEDMVVLLKKVSSAVSEGQNVRTAIITILASIIGGCCATEYGIYRHSTVQLPDSVNTSSLEQTEQDIRTLRSMRTGRSSIYLDETDDVVAGRRDWLVTRRRSD